MRFYSKILGKTKGGVMAQVIEEFFVPIKKVRKGDPLPEAPLPKNKATKPEKSVHPKLQEWLKKNRR
jgi:hypothetical protein